MSKYYIGQKLVCVDPKKQYIDFMSSGDIFTITSIIDNIYTLQKGKLEFDWANNSRDGLISSFFVDANKYISEQEFNSKFDAWLEGDTNEDNQG